MRKSKYDPLVDEVELINANSQYAHVRFPDGREDTVASSYLAHQVDRWMEIQHKLSHHEPHVTTDINEDVLNLTPAIADVKQPVNMLPKVNSASTEEPVSDTDIK